MSKFKVGDKVRVRSTPDDHWNLYGEMDKFCNQIVTIKSYNDVDDLYSIAEDERWCWRDSDFTPLKDIVFQPGDKVTVIDSNGSHWVTDMCKYIGKTLTIKTSTTLGNRSYYTVEENVWTWNSDDFVPYINPEASFEDLKFKIEYPTPSPQIAPTCKDIPATFGVVVYQKECLNCGTQHAFDDKYCRNCGKELIR